MPRHHDAIVADLNPLIVGLRKSLAAKPDAPEFKAKRQHFDQFTKLFEELIMATGELSALVVAAKTQSAAKDTEIATLKTENDTLKTAADAAAPILAEFDTTDIPAKADLKAFVTPAPTAVDPNAPAVGAAAAV